MKAEGNALLSFPYFILYFSSHYRYFERGKKLECAIDSHRPVSKVVVVVAAHLPVLYERGRLSGGQPVN